MGETLSINRDTVSGLVFRIFLAFFSFFPAFFFAIEFLLSVDFLESRELYKQIPRQKQP